MAENSFDNFPGKYLNPVYPRSFPDPFVLKFRGEYFAYCTDFSNDGKVFGVLRSRDLINWTEIGGAMNPLETNPPFYWAPEVTYSNGKFYLYYSAGNEILMELRVAISDRPDGGFVDCEKKLTTEDFAIDAHVFTDDDGERYLFYATDFLTHSHIGTGTVVDKMIDFFTLEGKPRPVTRARYDWQIYDPNRKEKGGVRWHTVEGAFVLKRKGIYFEMFSGGNWQNITYGVSFAITDDIKKDEEWRQFSDGENVLPILRTLPDLVVGPGHNSVIRGPNNRELFCVYHRWTENGRVLAIDRMDFAGTRIFIKGATYTPQIAPFQPAFADFFDGQYLNEIWKTAGEWKISGNETVSDISEQSELICGLTAESFLCEFSLRAVETIDESGSLGFSLGNKTEKTFEFLIFPKLNQAVFYWFEKGEIAQKNFPLPSDFNAQASHLARVEVDEFRVRLSLDETVVRFEKLLEKPSTQIALVAKNMKAAFSGFAFTKGFEDLFDWQDAEIEKHEEEKLANRSVCRIENRELFLSNKSESGASLIKGAAYENFEFVVNLRLIETFDENSDFGFLLLNEENKIISRFSIEREGENFYLLTETNSLKFALPKNFAPENYHQFRFLKLGEKLILQMEENELGEIPAPKDKAKISVFYKISTIAFDMIRLTIL
jgi:GH43 family beta-xylosidase